MIYWNKISIIMACLLIPLLGFGQGKVTRTHPKPDPIPTPVRPKSAPISIKLATDLDGTRRYYSVTEWSKMPITERINHNKLGILIKDGSEEFLLSLYNNMENGICSRTVPYSVAQNRTGGNLPSKKQLQIIRNNRQAISKASQNFGGDHLCSEKFWSSTGTLMDLGNNGSSSGNDGMFRFVTNGKENGLIYPVYSPSNIQLCDFISTESKELKVARFKGKYGIINNSNMLITPFKYDAIGCDAKWFVHKNGNDEMTIENYYDWISVSQDGKWGYVTREGKEIIPIIYEAVQNYSYEDDALCWVKKEGRYGAIDKKGNFIIPIDYETEIKFYNNQPARVKKDGKWGFLDQSGKTVIPFKYSSTRGFSWDGEMAPVSLNSKYGFIDKTGKVVIPLQYDFADEFSSHLAGVVMNGKIGFIDEKGNIVIPCIYDLEYSSDGNGKKLGFGMSFQGRVAMVKKNGLYGMIDKKGKNVTPFKYDRLSSAGSGGRFTAHIGNQTFYLDKGGNEYLSEEDRREKSDSILAYQGFAYEQYKMGRTAYKAKDYKTAYPWFKKSADGGDADGQCHLGYYYYYGYEPVNKNLNEAFRLFSLAAEQGNDDACYFLGWMYEHGQHVSTNTSKAIEWYRKSRGQRDSEERINALSNKL